MFVIEFPVPFASKVLFVNVEVEAGVTICAEPIVTLECKSAVTVLAEVIVKISTQAVPSTSLPLNFKVSVDVNPEFRVAEYISFHLISPVPKSSVISVSEIKAVLIATEARLSNAVVAPPPPPAWKVGKAPAPLEVKTCPEVPTVPLWTAPVEVVPPKIGA